MSATKSTTNGVTRPQFTDISLDLLRESPLNTRKHFDQVKLNELRDSISKSGILTPLLVRPRIVNGGAYEIAAGHRRYRAAQLAGATEAPCIVREMDDATFLEILTIENLQREDVHPLEEAEGYKNLLTLDGYEPKKIAQRVGKSESYVYDRLKLLQLTKPAQKLFLENRFSVKHAIVLARLSKADQERCMSRDDPEVGGLWVHERDSHPALGVEDPTSLVDDPRYDPDSRLKPVSVGELQAWVDNHVRFTAPDENTPHLFTGTVANLAAAEASKQKVIEISRDHQLKEDAKHPDGKRTYCVTSWKRADGQPEEEFPGEQGDPSKPCDYSVLGLVVAGRGRGESFQVCIDKKRCTTHWAAEIKERNRREREREKEGAASGPAKQEKESSKPSWQIQQERQKRDAETRNARWEKGRDVVLAAVADKLGDLRMDSTGAAGKYVWELLQDGLYGLDDGAKLAAKFAVKRGTTAIDLMRHVIMCALIDRGTPEHGDNEAALQKDLDRLGIKVNVKALLDAANPKPKADKPAPPTTSRKSPKKRRKVTR